jgi:hypothetical protein
VNDSNFLDCLKARRELQTATGTAGSGHGGQMSGISHFPFRRLRLFALT